jgi:beta-xylosidase
VALCSGLVALGTNGAATGLTAPAQGSTTDGGIHAAAPSSATDAAYDSPPPTTDPASPGTFIGFGGDQTDPFVLAEDGTYYLFTSHEAPGGIANVPVRTATVLGHWGPVTDALPDLPAWAEPGWAWAPDVHRFGDHDVLYFTALVRGSSLSTMCIGAAVGSRITGPFVAQPAPLVCQVALGGSIDPRTFVDKGGQAYLLWKSDQNAVSRVTPTQIYSQPLSDDGLQLLGRAAQIFGPDEPWQGEIVEAPDLVQVAGAYFLFYSGYWFNQPGYAIGVAFCVGPLGPCADSSRTPLLGSNEQGSGPGEESVFADAHGIWLLYAPFHSSFLPPLTPPRPATVARLGFGNAGAYLAATPSDPAET